MAPIKNARALFAAIPTGYVVPGVNVIYDDSQTIDLDTIRLNGGFLAKTLVLSIDPYMRNKMRDPSKKSYSPAYESGQPIYGYGIARVIRTDDANFKAGDHVYSHLIRHEEYAVYRDEGQFRILDNVGVPWSYYVGILGMPGQTAYHSWKEYSNSKKGETVFVSTAAGAVGSFVVQLAKQDGLKVIASSGSDDKVQFARECGADISFNYKKENVSDVLEREGGLDIFYDNVGGEQFDAALLHSHRGARFIECGMSSLYNSTNSYTFKNLIQIVANEIRIQGFVRNSLGPKYDDEFYSTVPQLVRDGKIRFREDISHGLEQVGQAFVDIGTGANHGKKVIVVSNE